MGPLEDADWWPNLGGLCGADFWSPIFRLARRTYRPTPNDTANHWILWYLQSHGGGSLGLQFDGASPGVAGNRLGRRGSRGVGLHERVDPCGEPRTLRRIFRIDGASRNSDGGVTWCLGGARI